MRATPGLSIRLSRSVRSRIAGELLVGQRRVGIDECQPDLAIQRRVQCLPELQVRRSAVEDQQPVAAASDGGAGYEVHVLIRRCRLDRRLARHVEGQPFAGGIAAVVGWRPTRGRRGHGAHGHRAWLGPLGLAAVETPAPPEVSTGTSGSKSSAAGRGILVVDAVVRAERGVACGFVAHRWSFPHPGSGNRRRRPAPSSRRAVTTPRRERIPLIRVRERHPWAWSDGPRGRLPGYFRVPCRGGAGRHARTRLCFGYPRGEHDPPMIGSMISPSTSSRSIDPRAAVLGQ